MGFDGIAGKCSLEVWTETPLVPGSCPHSIAWLLLDDPFSGFNVFSLRNECHVFEPQHQSQRLHGSWLLSNAWQAELENVYAECVLKSSSALHQIRLQFWQEGGWETIFPILRWRLCLWRLPSLVMVIREILEDTGGLILQVTRIDSMFGMTWIQELLRILGRYHFMIYRMHELVASPLQVKFKKIEKKDRNVKRNIFWTTKRCI